MKVIEGRSDDFISLPDGRALSPRVLTSRVKQVSGIKQYRIAQKETGALIVQIVRGGAFSRKTAGQVRAALTETTGYELEVSVEVVEHLSRGNGDKYRPIRSSITPRF
jgi:phenylacetate-coenzyme A ligase PaaK-like adenylate-forming protein